MTALSTSLQIISLVLQCVLIVLLLFSFSRRYSILVVYSLTYLIATVLGEIVVRRNGIQSNAYRSFYWWGEVILDLLLFLTVIVLIYQALEDSPARSRAAPLLAGIIGLALVLPFLVLHSRVFSSRWFDGASQMLNFAAALLNLGLWTALLLRRKRDPRLLGVSLSVGITVTGAAMSYGLLLLVASGHDFIKLLIPIAHVVGLVLWCRAFLPRTS